MVILIGWIGRTLAGAWMVLAGSVGFAARAVGRGARDLDPHHRRDGVGLLTLGVAIVLGASLWGRMGNAVGHAIQTVVDGALGSLAWVVPLLVVLLAWRYLRHPDRNSETARAAIGWTALLLGAAGLIHIAKNIPRPAEGSAAMRAGGGLVGYAMSAPLSAALTSWVAALLLVLLAAFGILVISGTPLHRIPERLRQLRALLGHPRPATAMTSTTASWRSTRTTRPGPAARRAASAARSPGRSGSARPSSRASTSSPMTPRSSNRTSGSSRTSGAPPRRRPGRGDGSDGLAEALGFGQDDAGPHDAGRRRWPPCHAAVMTLARTTLTRITLTLAS